MNTRDLIITVNDADSVAVALEDIAPGTVISNSGMIITAWGEIPKGHKIALRDISDNEPVIKYGNVIGHASRAIYAGEHVHSHNLRTALAVSQEYRYEKKAADASVCPSTECFRGYRRADGRAGIRNEIWIIPTVGCVNALARIVEAEALKKITSRSVEGIIHFEHPYGCSQLGDDQLYTQKILAGLARHPNAGGVLILGLGCENNNIEEFKKVLGPYDPARIKFLNAQDADDEMSAAVACIGELCDAMNDDRRTDIPFSDLVIGLKCGGSDGFSGITANPLLGLFSDTFTACGGTAVLTEVPEMFGAEHLLMARAADENIFSSIVGMVNGFKNYYTRYGQVIYENPSPGNKSGGITTLEEKSLGCVQKGGHSPVTGVTAYGDRINQKGLVLLSAPGNDIVAVSALAAAGCQMILFTTGRGTPLGSPVPVIKVSTNTALYEKKGAWIDFNAGSMMDGASSSVLADNLRDLIIKTASGKKTKSEERGFRDFAIFKDGVTL